MVWRLPAGGLRDLGYDGALASAQHFDDLPSFQSGPARGIAFATLLTADFMLPPQLPAEARP